MANPRPVPDAPIRPLKILQVASGLPGWGGIESHVINLAEELRKRGHDVTIACRSDGYVTEEAKKRALPTVTLICRKKHDWAAAPSFRAVYEREKYDVVHVHGGADHVVPPAVAKWSGVPAVLMTRHTPKPVNAISRLLYGSLCYHHLVAIADYVRGVLVGSGIPASRITTIHHGTDTDAFSPQNATEDLRTEWGIAPDAFVVGFAGRFVSEKGGDVFLKALAKVPEAVGVLIGDGPLKDDWKALAEREGIAPERLIWAGFRNDIANALNAVDVFVLPSVWAEPCAAVVQQAMALEKPVIGTRLGGTPEMIAENETGLLVPAGEPDALAEALRDLFLRGASERRVMGQRGRERVLEHFSLWRMAERTEALYDSLVAANAPERRS